VSSKAGGEGDVPKNRTILYFCMSFSLAATALSTASSRRSAANSLSSPARVVAGSCFLAFPASCSWAGRAGRRSACSAWRSWRATSRRRLRRRKCEPGVLGESVERGRWRVVFVVACRVGLGCFAAGGLMVAGVVGPGGVGAVGLFRGMAALV
jgi:hypothetical protein